jgi:hypothetical protein
VLSSEGVKNCAGVVVKRDPEKFFEFFTVPIRNANTRAAYYRAIQQFSGTAFMTMAKTSIFEVAPNHSTVRQRLSLGEGSS